MEQYKLVVNGTLMRGLPLNRNLEEAGARFLREARTAPHYRLWSIKDRYPGMQRSPTGGVAVTVEVWELPAEGLISVLQQEPPGLCVGKVEMDNGEILFGVLAENAACGNQKEISRYGGWRAYIAASDLGSRPAPDRG